MAIINGSDKLIFLPSETESFISKIHQIREILNNNNIQITSERMMVTPQDSQRFFSIYGRPENNIDFIEKSLQSNIPFLGIQFFFDGQLDDSLFTNILDCRISDYTDHR